MSVDQNKETGKRRTFAIVSHPDAGKTTLTEKLLLYGGAIQTAGAVKSNKIRKTATSDFMEIERQRGISVATSVMGFEYEGKKINILDTPGHQDFAEDTFRTLTAVDSVIVVIDVAKGVEAQTRKLMEVCRMRNTPVMVFINKLDREGQDPFDLLDEIENELNIQVKPFTWPVGMGKTLKGIYNLEKEQLHYYNVNNKQKKADITTLTKLTEEIKKQLGDSADELEESIELIREVYPDFNIEDYLQGKLAPVFFGSALNNFGVKELLDQFITLAPPPKERAANERIISAGEDTFSGFIFKIHANMDPNHRDRIAFMRICSGVFERNKYYLHVRQDKKYKFANPTSFMAAKKSVIDQAFPGDIVGLYDTGNLKIGDALTEGEIINFKGIPNFSPETFRYVVNTDPMKSKQLDKGLMHLTDEGLAQLFIHSTNGRKIIGTVGTLQFDVIKYRLEHEYGAKCKYEPINLYKACWVRSEDTEQLQDLKKRKAQYLAKDKNGEMVFLAESNYILQNTIEKYPTVKFSFSSEN